MDDDEEEREFSKSIVFDFFQQADSTFDKMDDYLCVFHTLVQWRRTNKGKNKS